MLLILIICIVRVWLARYYFRVSTCFALLGKRLYGV
jgi:hypothetical protein